MPSPNSSAATPRLICLNKPYGVPSQFTPEGLWRGTKGFIDLPGVYVAGRLDADSEGLLLISDPRCKTLKTYWGLAQCTATKRRYHGSIQSTGPFTWPLHARSTPTSGGSFC
ncbi:hypothetical protein [Polaromonas sp. YR568]|uniref:hypothetical protein n=1 Tax=Polaromonas sp. YR568 TaxID=1855301 RepID=UPI00398C1446